MRAKGINIAAGLIAISLSAIATGTASAAARDDARFEAVTNAFVERLLVSSPETATELGDHRYDARSSDYSMRGVAADRALYHKTLLQLAAIPGDKLSPDNSVDRSILQNELQKRLFEIEVMHTPTRNPLVYAPAEGIYLLIARDFAPLKERLVSVKARLESFPKTLEAAKKNLDNPPQVFTETAIQRNK